MNHWVIAPILIPMAFAIVLLLIGLGRRKIQRRLGLTSCLLQLAVAVGLLLYAGSGELSVYYVGKWPAPYGIVLVLDRLAAVMLTITAVIAVASLIYATQGIDDRGRNFHALFQFQLMGLNGAFLTGDLFNLFVFFELLLISSYGLLLHGGGADRLRNGFHYVVFNLVASALFLVAVALIYANLGTLNMADLARESSAIPPEHATAVRAGGLLLLVVFGAKAALLPLYFWLPRAYHAASAPVAALFSVMTKVGAYAILRVFTLVFGHGVGEAAGVADPWVLTLALATLAAGTLGLLASRDVRTLTAYSVIISVGMMLGGIGLFNVEGIRAGVYYLAQSTLVLAGLFLLADLVRQQRGEHGDRLEYGAAVHRPVLLGTLFLVAAVAVVGLPPLSGFIGKALLLQAAVDIQAVRWVWPVVLVSSALALVAFSRAGSVLFWKTEPREPGWQPAPTAPGLWVPSAALLSFAALLMLGAGPALEYADATARQLLNPALYIQAVLETQNVQR